MELRWREQSGSSLRNIRYGLSVLPIRYAVAQPFEAQKLSNMHTQDSSGPSPWVSAGSPGFHGYSYKHVRFGNMSFHLL
jgi:hypothetical protein